jgi:uncharacterized GH25 family protein
LNRTAPLLVTAALVAAPLPALAHEFWLAPSSYRAAAGQTVEIAAFVGTGFRGERKPYAAPRAMVFMMRGPREHDLRRVGVNGDLTMAHFVTADAGGVLVAYQSSFATIELPAAEFDAYLKLEGLDGPLAARARQGAKAGPGRERYARCPKTWIAGDEPGRATKPVDLPLEIVPLADPSAALPLSVEVRLRGRPLKGALVRAWRQPLTQGWQPKDATSRDSVGVAFETRTDGKGVAVLRGLGPGEWLVSSVHMTPCPERAVADWESLWASLTFARSGASR